MKVLLSGHGADREALDAARRRTAYGRLVLLSAAPEAPDLAGLLHHERLAGVDVDVQPVDEHDFTAALDAARAVLRRHARDEVRVHVAGGPNLVASALLLAAFQHGVPAFFCHARGVADLPIALEVQLADRLGPAEREVLVALTPGGPSKVEGLAPALPAGVVKGALLRLRKDGLVKADHLEAELTVTGAYYREHLVVRGGA